MVLVSGKTWWTPYQWAHAPWLRVSRGDRGVEPGGALTSPHPQDPDAYFRAQEENAGGSNSKEEEAQEEAQKEAKDEAKEGSSEQEENESGAKKEEGKEKSAGGSQEVEETAGENAASEKEKGNTEEGNTMEMTNVNK